MNKATVDFIKQWLLKANEGETLEYKNIALEIKDIVERKIDNILKTNI